MGGVAVGVDGEFQQEPTTDEIKNRRQGWHDGGQTFSDCAHPAVTGRASALFQVVLGQVDRQLGDEGRAAPIRTQATWVDRRDIRESRCRVIAREGVAVALVQVGVVVAQVERELLPGKCDANVPVGVALKGNAVCKDCSWYPIER